MLPRFARPEKIGIAVTGSSASMALCKIARSKYPDIIAFTMLTPKTKYSIPMIQRQMKQLRIPFETVPFLDKPRLEQNLVNVAKELQVMTIMTGHTLEDDIDTQRIISRESFHCSNMVELTHSPLGMHKMCKPFKRTEKIEFDGYCKRHKLDFVKQEDKNDDSVLHYLHDQDLAMQKRVNSIIKDCIAFNPATGVAYLRANPKDPNSWLKDPFVAHQVLLKIIGWVTVNPNVPGFSIAELFRQYICKYAPSTTYQILGQNGVALCSPVMRIGPDVWTIARQPMYSSQKGIKVPLSTTWQMWDKRFMIKLRKAYQKPLFIRPLLVPDIVHIAKTHKKSFLSRTIRTYLNNTPEPCREALPCIVDEENTVLAVPSLGFNADANVKIESYFYIFPELYEPVNLK